MIQKTPNLFGLVYRAGAAWSSTGVRSPVYLANSLYSSALNQFLEEEKIGAVLSTHLYGMQVMKAINSFRKNPIPNYGILTDYTAIPFLQETKTDILFTPHASLTPEIVRAGVQKECIRPTGIPVQSTFRKPLDKSVSRSILKLPPDAKIILVMTGGVGCEKMSSICDPLLNRGMYVCLFTGNNQNLKHRLTEYYKGQENHLRILGFTDQVSLYMNGADVLISKAGGLSSTEAAVAGIPLVHFCAIPGCESANARFFERFGLSFSTSDPEKAAILASWLANHPRACEKMKERQKFVISANAASQIADLLLKGEGS
jgi:processive 1,2-diacylglycerol beta-glucosyltransferase